MSLGENMPLAQNAGAPANVRCGIRTTGAGPGEKRGGADERGTTGSGHQRLRRRQIHPAAPPQRPHGPTTACPAQRYRHDLPVLQPGRPDERAGKHVVRTLGALMTYSRRVRAAALKSLAALLVGVIWSVISLGYQPHRDRRIAGQRRGLHRADVPTGFPAPGRDRRLGRRNARYRFSRHRTVGAPAHPAVAGGGRPDALLRGGTIRRPVPDCTGPFAA